MTTVIGFNPKHHIKTIEFKNKSKSGIQATLERQGWTNLVFLKKRR